LRILCFFGKKFFKLSILRRVQAAGAGTEGDVHAFGIFRVPERKFFLTV